MLILDRRIAGLGAILTARRDHRDLALEVDPRLRHRQTAAEVCPGCSGIVAGLEPELTLAVVAEPPALEDDRPLQRGLQILGITHRPPWSGRDPDPGKKLLFAQPVLTDRKHRGRWMQRDARREPRQGLDRQILK